ncbi:MAG: GntR family transcriptional regulator [Anaerolineae bacterium]
MLQANSSVPLYRQLYQELREAIEEGEFKVGHQLPSERQLAAEYGISRLTVRKGLGLLRQDGYVRAYQGKGSFVARSQPQTYRRTGLLGFTERMLQQGMRPSSRLVNFGVVQASGEVARRLRLRDHEQVIKAQRLRLANDIPVALHTAYLPYPLCQALLRVDLERTSLYRALEEVVNLRLSHADQTVQAVLGHRSELALLDLEPPAAVMRLRRLTYDEQGRIVEYLEGVYHCDRCDMVSSSSF